MAFASIASVGYSREDSNTTVHDAVVPSGIVSGDLLLMLRCNDSIRLIDAANAASLGWTIADTVFGGSAVCAQTLYRFADGSETNFTYGLTETANETSITRILRITGAHASAAPEAAHASAGNSNVPNSPLVTPTWGLDDTLWISFYGIDDGAEPATAYPTNYTLYQFTDGTTNVAGGCSFAMAARELAAASEDPGAFTATAADSWGATTIAIRPAGGGGGPVVAPLIYQYRRRLEIA